MTKKEGAMEPDVYEELKTVLAMTKEKQVDINRAIQNVEVQVNRGKKPPHDITKLMKMQMDNSRLQMQLLEKISKFSPSTENSSTQKATIEDWEIVLDAIARGDYPTRESK